MRSRFGQCAGLIVLLLGLGLSWAAGSRGQAPPMAGPQPASWEYRTVHSNGNPGYQSDKALDAIGEEGWELVSVAVRGPYAAMYVFKRPKGR